MKMYDRTADSFFVFSLGSLPVMVTPIIIASKYKTTDKRNKTSGFCLSEDRISSLIIEDNALVPPHPGQ